MGEMKPVWVVFHGKLLWRMCRKGKKNVEELCERFIRLFEPSVMDGADTKNLIQQDSDILHLILTNALLSS